MAQDRQCETGEVVYRELARLTDGTFIEPFTMNDPRAMEKVLLKLKAAPKRIGHADDK
jgi:hypothetical protein